jgi:DNA polymerase (family 10)
MNKFNKEVADLLFKIADALEILGEMQFKVLAYRKAARVISELTEDLRKIYKEGKLEEIPGIGEGIAKKIKEYIETGKMKKAEEVLSKIPPGLLPLMSIPSLGPKTIALAYKKLGVKDINDLKRVLKDGSLARLPGMGEKKIENIIKGIELWEKGKERFLLGEVYPIVENIVSELKSHKEIIEAIPAGSYRRMKETVGDIDILVMTEESEKAVNIFCSLKGVERVLAEGGTKGSCIFSGNIQVDLRAIPPECFGSALQYFTGSKAHNVHLRSIAKQKGLKISEYGVFKEDKKIAGENEEDVYKSIGLIWIPPEMREDTGEIELAIAGKLPKLIEYDEVKGDLHVHSKYSDGTMTLEELSIWGKKMGYEYIGVCDHSKSAKYAGGLEIDDIRKKMDEIKRINDKKVGCYLIMGAEVDILPDGSLDYPDEILKEIDLVLVSVHTGFKKDNTDRILKALDNPYVHGLSHPTGRLLGQREGYPVDIEAVIEKCAQKNKLLEINAYYERLDLYDIYLRKAKEKNVKFLIGTDAHHLGQLWMMKLGIGMARRGWLTKEDIINTMDYNKLLEFLKSLR